MLFYVFCTVSVLKEIRNLPFCSYIQSLLFSTYPFIDDFLYRAIQHKKTKYRPKKGEYSQIRFWFVSKEGWSVFYRMGFEKESYTACRLREGVCTYKGQDGK